MDAVSNGGRIHGVSVRDTLNGAEAQVQAKVVVNASGPWFDRVAARIEPHPEQRVRTTKGIHIACEPVSRRAAVLSSKIDGRLFFVIPLLGFSWIGTTDTDFSDDPSTAHATAEDVEYLMQSASGFFPALQSKDIFWSNAGVRALVKEKGRESSVSRAHHVVDGDGLISVIGGKITGYRAIAEEVTDLLCKKLGVDKPCQTADLPLPGARGTAPDLNASDDTLHYLRSLYGDRMRDVLQVAGTEARLLQRLAPPYPDIVAQVIFAVREEQCLNVADYMRRRSLLAFNPDQGMKAVPAVASWMASELGWNSTQTAAQIDAYQRWVDETQAFRKTLPLTKLN
jgi:glycerol-3-phosphate dehydrogenase